MSIADILDGFSTNPYLGFGLFSVGTGVAMLHKRIPGAAIHLRKHMMVKLREPFREESYQWLLQWMTQKFAKITKHSSVQKECEIIKKNSELIPLVESNHDRYKYMGLPLKTVTLAAFGRDHMYIDILEEARQLKLKGNEKKETNPTMKAEWLPFSQPQNVRPVEPVILGAGIAANMLRARKNFTTYPNRREYLLYGLPDCGKSSLIRAPAKELDYGIYFWNLSERIITDELLNYLLKGAAEKPILVWDDIDGIPVLEGVQQNSAYEEFKRVMLSEKFNTQNLNFMNRTRRYPWLPNSFKAYRTQYLPNNLLLSKQAVTGASTPLIVKHSCRNFQIGL